MIIIIIIIYSRYRKCSDTVINEVKQTDTGTDNQE